MKKLTNGMKSVFLTFTLAFICACPNLSEACHDLSGVNLYFNNLTTKTIAATSETGHPINVANFESLISFCNGYGTKYNPAQNAIKLTALDTLHTNAKSALKSVNDKLAKFTVATNQRQLAFEPINKLTTRLIAALDASGTTDKIVEDARTIGRKITGARKNKKILIPNPDDSISISVSQQSYNARLENYSKLKELLEEEPLYKPNETDLKITTLTTQITDMATKNTAVISATTTLSNARVARNHVLYDKNTGLVDVALEVKKYVKSVFGTSSPEYKQVSKIKFTRP